MPELPDLQVFAQNLQKKLKGKKVEKISVAPKVKVNVSVSAFKKAISNAIVNKVVREGKELHFNFNNKNVVALHLMLHGRLYLFEKKNDQKHTLFEFLFSDGIGLALTDYQKKATITLNPPKKEAPDALSPGLNYAYLNQLLGSKKVNIKTLLMDQKFIRGIGNAYADEILWSAGISPLSISNKIPDAKIKALARSIKSVLNNAEKQIKKEDPSIISGEIRDFLVIHNADKKTSPKGGKIHSEMINSRITYYADEQELYK